MNLNHQVGGRAFVEKAPGAGQDRQLVAFHVNLEQIDLGLNEAIQCARRNLELGEIHAAVTGLERPALLGYGNALLSEVLDHGCQSRCSPDRHAHFTAHEPLDAYAFRPSM